MQRLFAATHFRVTAAVELRPTAMINVRQVDYRQSKEPLRANRGLGLYFRN
jgi:hypothetical protein